MTLAKAEALCVHMTNDVARSRFWVTNPVTKDLADLARLTEAMSGKKVLDIGCGYGPYAPDFIGAGLDYLGIDNSPEMIREARLAHPKADFQIMSMNRPALRPESFDGIWSCCSLGFTPKKFLGTTLQQLRQLLTPKGVLVAVVPNCGISFDQTSEFDRIPFWRALFTPDEFRQLFRDAGFQVAGFWEDHDNMAMSLLAKK